ncbi:xanthine dehydrogenase family protein molybdopterin-binding subunit [Streptomyces muensis]|uniref:Xanthine dehydrogenase family protein molybdopterin-binding subunit n=1 Tax=Streptomyces muensis TaxID=1077944 RepID=A0A9X1PU28_STRM4|nr:molybdopterin cofactor-binding domain-containing protein [Streptomyces muensis]MCF1593507.1 xanthine dehydrogenase family protein molybdopterin-binding subunit [Streptomyces muensis]
MNPQTRAAVGAPLSRVDGRLKVTGRARYAADFPHTRTSTPDEPPAPEGAVHAVVVDSGVGRGRITGIDTRAALAQPGVLRVISHLDAPGLPYRGAAEREPLRVFQDDRVRFFGQPVAVVVATTLESAQHAASLVEVRYDSRQPATRMTGERGGEPETYARGEADAAIDSAPVVMEMTYRLARTHHNPMEPHATVARWDGGTLTVWDKTQSVIGTRDHLAGVFGLPPESVRVISPFVGGSFGSCLRSWPHVTLAALAARETRRPVELALTRRQMYFGTGYRPAYEYTVRIGSDRRGRLTGMVHDVRAETSRHEKFTEPVLLPGQTLYGMPHVSQAYRTIALDVNTPTYLRGTGFTTGAHVIESALDELAHELGIDPVELRLRNEPDEDPAGGSPFSTRRLRECYRVGVREFGWHHRDPRPRSTREGDWLIGMGMAAGVHDCGRAPCQARVRLDADGTALVETSTSDMGPGTYTSQTQIAADALGLTMRQVTFRLGDSTLAPAPAHGGSATMAVVGSAVRDGCDRLRRSAVELAVGDEESPLYGVDAQDVAVRAGRLYAKSDPARGETYARLLTRNDRTHLEALGTHTPGRPRHALYAYSAVFAEVAVDRRLGMVRVRRMLGVYDAGRIINPKLAESQALGGMVGGIGAALLERTVTDHRDGRIVNADLADYLVPVNADVPDLRAVYLDGEDREANPLGVKGLGEVVLVGVAPAIVNAVFHATGRRVRDLPVTAEALL